MDFEDTPDEAAFRAKARAFSVENARTPETWRGGRLSPRSGRAPTRDGAGQGFSAPQEFAAGFVGIRTGEPSGAVEATPQIQNVIL